MNDAMGLLGGGDGSLGVMRMPQGCGGGAPPMSLSEVEQATGLRQAALERLLAERENVRAIAFRLNDDRQKPAKFAFWPTRISELNTCIDRALYLGVLKPADFLPGRERQPSIASFTMNEQIFGLSDKPAESQPVTQPCGTQSVACTTAQQMVDRMAATPPTPPPPEKAVLPVCETLAKFAVPRRPDDRIVALAFEELRGEVEKPILLAALRGIRRGGLLATLRRQRKLKAK